MHLIVRQIQHEVRHRRRAGTRRLRRRQPRQPPRCMRPGGSATGACAVWLRVLHRRRGLGELQAGLLLDCAHGPLPPVSAAAAAATAVAGRCAATAGSGAAEAKAQASH